MLLEKELKINNVLDFYEIEKIYKNILITKDNYIKIIKIEPVNYELKTEFEKKTILNSYKTFLKICDFNFQIIVLSKKEDISPNINLIKKHLLKKEEELTRRKIFAENEIEKKEIEKEIIRNRTIFLNYINYIQKLNNSKNITSKFFYIVLSEAKVVEEVNKRSIFNYFIKINEETIDLKTAIIRLEDKSNKIIRTIYKCGNNARELNESEIMELFNLKIKERENK